MKNIFITDSRAHYDQQGNANKILYEEGLIGACGFIDQEELLDFNNSIVGMENEAYRLMLVQFDNDIKTISDRGLKFKANRFISKLNDTEKAYSTLYNFHQHFVAKKYLFQLVIEKILKRFATSDTPLTLSLSENYYLTQELPFNIKSSSYYPAYKNLYLKFLLKQVYYFGISLFAKARAKQKTDIAVFLLDIPNGFDLFVKFAELIQAQDKLKMTFVVIDSGNPKEKTVDTSVYNKGNINVIYLYKQKMAFYSDYSSFYDVCQKLNPLYSIFKKARYCEMQDSQYGFTDNIISSLSPDVCIYGMTHEYGRVLANVCSSYNIPTICVDYASLFDSYLIEKRIKFDIRACMSEVSSYNWKRHNDPTTRHETIGFCKIDEWRKKLDEKALSGAKRFFDNDQKTILFISTYHPDANSPLLKEKTRIVEQLSETCHRNGWNLLIKKHPAEFDTLADEVIDRNGFPNQRYFQHHEMSLFDSIYYGDFVCTQNSTAYVEVLYLNKPFSYVTINGDNVWVNASYFAQEKEVHTFGSVKEYEQYVMANTDDSAYQQLLEDFQRLQTKYLYKTDGKSTERLLELTKSFVK